MSETNGQALQAIVDDFNASQNEIEVTAEYQGSYDDTKTKLGAALQSGKFPDICQMYDIGTKYMVDMGKIIPVEDMFSTTGYDKKTVMDVITSYYTVDGKQQSMPFNVSTPMLYYNKDAFTKAGIDASTAPTTFAEVKADSQKIASSGACSAGFAQAIYGWFFEQEIATLGQLYGDNDNGRTNPVTKVEWDSNGSAKKIMDNWMDLLNNGNAANYGQKTADTQTAFFSGQCGMMLESTAVLKKAIDNSKFEVGTGNFPKIEANADGGVIIGGASLWLMDTGDKQKEEAAWKFLEFTTKPEEQAKWSMATGYFAINEKAYDQADMKAYIEKYPGFLTAVNQLKATPVNKYTAGVLSGVAAESRKSFQDYMEKVINGEMTVDDAITQCAKDVNEAITNYNDSVG
jgi:sn-glycerol 3-phosphate transport system substrate-binding protein